MATEQVESTGRPLWQRVTVAVRRWRRSRSDWLQVPPEPLLLTDNAVQAVLLDVSLLLDYLNRLPEPRLARAFAAASIEPSPATPAVAPGPPCAHLTYFIGRIAAIAARGEAATPTDRTEPSYVTKGDVGDTGNATGRSEASRLDDLAFLITARDFLATIAAPASLDTIRVTRAYRAARMMRRVKVREDSSREGAKDDRELFMSRYGIAIARRVGRFQLLAGFLLWFSLFLSFMVYSGQVLMHENAALQSDQLNYENRVKEAAVQEEALIQAALRVEPSMEGTLMARGYCHLRANAQPDLGIDVVRIAASSGNGTATPQPVKIASSDQPRLRLYISDRQRVLCEELQRLEQRETELKRVHGRWIDLARPVLYVVTPWILLHRTPQSDPQNATLQVYRYGMQQLINGLLAGIMPAMYAALGALASLFRRLAKKAEDEQLGSADYGGMMSSLVLGALTGTVIGLFVNVVPQSGSAGLPLSTTALALLAGYAADRVFAMFDSLADRMFVLPERAVPIRS